MGLTTEEQQKIINEYHLHDSDTGSAVVQIAILSTRDTLMAEGTVRMLREHPEPSAAVVVMGRAHVNGYERELVLKHGFERA